ncbi:hypothetical protein DPMN_152140 [Dreissena polymorpha]|uniref:Uncharacterized protein n=1 Tax=Dreissena polymorpha TaxID=45954 RepID=A0A9D4FL93_DREPO|nr:hypothetical protein DPMN_152140 [Dreissena polymorpha]
MLEKRKLNARTNPKTSPEQSEINKTNVLTKFHDDEAKNVTSIVKTAPPPGSHVFLPIGTICECDFYSVYNFKLDRDFIETKLLTKFHKDRAINVASRVFTNKCGRTDGQTMDKDRSQKLI